METNGNPAVVKRPDAGTSTDKFKQAIEKYSNIEVVQRYITGGSCVLVDDSQYAELRQRVAARFGIRHNEILIIGSAKLGFSIAPRKRWKAFHEESDIDVAITSTNMYLKVWHELSRLVDSDHFLDWRRKSKFLQYKIHGWIRPDLLPRSPALPLSDEWFEFFRSVTTEGTCGPYKVNAGLYYDIDFLESYQARGVNLCREEITEAR
ncbi:hypothetical protein [Saccharomonospora halophila]|uniref:hypothetical protein n=1 Tax=Saccharomonospora halophila TaxID=129922 RepID=UPI0012FC1923|nr:hypothetical protein [Saccharomonospora halophila]